MLTPRAPLVTDALVAGFKAALGDAVVVVDGEDTSWSAKAKDAVFVGVDDPEEDNPPRAAQTSHDWASIGAQSVDESGELFCTIAVGRGSGTLKVVRDLGYGYLQTIATWLRTSVTSSPWLDVDGLLFGGISESSHTQGMTDKGPVCYVHFTIAYRART